MTTGIPILCILIWNGVRQLLIKVPGFHATYRWPLRIIPSDQQNIFVITDIYKSTQIITLFVVFTIALDVLSSPGARSSSVAVMFTFMVSMYTGQVHVVVTRSTVGCRNGHLRCQQWEQSTVVTLVLSDHTESVGFPPYSCHITNIFENTDIIPSTNIYIVIFTHILTLWSLGVIYIFLGGLW